MIEIIDWKDQTPESRETPKDIIQTTTNANTLKTMNDIPEESKIRIKSFLQKMWQTQTGKQNGAKKIQEEFCTSDEFIRWSKDVIKKLKPKKLLVLWESTGCAGSEEFNDYLYNLMT